MQESVKVTSTNPEYEAEKKAREQKIERQYTMYFDEVLKGNLNTISIV